MAGETGPGVLLTESLRCTTADGVGLECDLAVPPGARAAAVLTHPHPRYGGDRRALVTHALFVGLPRHGIATFRFDFRGAGGSGGTHDGGDAERLDVQAALEDLAWRCPGLPLVLCGYSFGADVAAAVDGGRHPTPAARVLVAPPLAVLPAHAWTLGRDGVPTLVLVPEHDQFCPPATAAVRLADRADVHLRTVAQADHFLAGFTTAVVEAVVRFVGECVAPVDPHAD